MRIEIIEPNGKFFDEEGTFLEFTTIDGREGVYEDHIPVTTILEPCMVKIHQGNEVKKAAVLGGFVEIQKKHIVILAEDANWPEDIDVERAEASRKRAEERLIKKEPGTDMVRAEASLKRALARLAATKK